MEKDHSSTQALSIGIEIGGTKTQAGLGSAAWGLLPGGTIRRAVIREQGAGGILQDLVLMVDELLDLNRISISQVSKIGIGFGGPLDSSRGVTLQSFQIDGWTDFPLKDWAEAQWHRPVVLENDASTAGLAEHKFGQGRGCRRLFYVTVGSGVGGGWILNGGIDNGQGLGAAEIGHIWVPDPHSRRFVELEQVCSGWAIGQRARQAATGAHSLMEKLAGSVDRIDAKIVYVAAEKGDETALCILQETCQTLGMALSNIVALLHPERVVLGGGVSLMGPLFWNLLQAEFRARIMPLFAPQVELVLSELKEDVVVIGALCLGESG